jgi:hypothetical protein
MAETCAAPLSLIAWEFPDRSAARQWVWDRLGAEGVARFPFPPHGRIPNFAVPSWRPHDSLRSGRGRAPQRSRSIRIHRNARCEPRRCAAASPFLYRRPDCVAGSYIKNGSPLALRNEDASRSAG